jgi:hypothetical protein
LRSHLPVSAAITAAAAVAAAAPAVEGGLAAALQAVPPPPAAPPTPIAAFYGRLAESIHTCLHNYERFPQLGVLSVLRTICKDMPEFVDRYCNFLVRVLQVRAQTARVELGPFVRTDSCSRN